VTAIALMVTLAWPLLAQQGRRTDASAPGTLPDGGRSEYSPGGIVLLPTSHPPFARDLPSLWLVPANSKPVVTEQASAMLLQARGEYAKALSVLSKPSSSQGTIGLHAMYDMGMALLNLGRPEEARPVFQTIRERKPIGYLNEGARYGEAQASEALKDFPAAIAIYEDLLQEKSSRPDEVLVRLGTAAKMAGQTDKAVNAFMRVYYEYPLSEYAETAGTELARLAGAGAATAGSERYTLELTRAGKLFDAKSYAAARTAFQALRSAARGEDRELVELRVAESNYFLRRTRDARDGLRPYLKDASRLGEVTYFQALVSRDLGSKNDYLTTIRRVISDFPTESWAEDALNNLASYYIINDEDDSADETFRDLYAKYPKGRFAERAAWKIGWRAYLEGDYAESVKFFERAAADFPRSDYRPSWLYWSGRAHEQLGERPLAESRYSLVLADYLNSYYGRLASKRVNARAVVARVISNDAEGDIRLGTTLPPNGALIRALIGAGLYDHATRELKYAQRTYGDSPTLQATLAWVSHEQGRAADGQQRFTLLRGAITTMRRAYPQFLAAGGEQLPREILTVIFPLEYWDLIQKHAAAQKLDPYLVAALIAQESTFAPEVRSAANAVGLMQLLPSTARQQARKLKIPYSSRLLTNPEANIRLGTAYFAEKIREFGSVHLALASYNAGEAAVRQWVNERPGLGVEEFIDDIPYPETQTYVRRILGTVDDYRRLYGK
jgi:soluble lytic murein transglycosylase